LPVKPKTAYYLYMATVREATHARMCAELRASAEAADAEIATSADATSADATSEAAAAHGAAAGTAGTKVAPKVAPHEVSKRVSEQWKQLSNEERAGFEAQAAAALQTYEAECAAAGVEPERNGPKRKGEASASPLQPLGVQGVINSGREACAAGGAQGGDKQRPPAKERAPRTKTPKQLARARLDEALRVGAAKAAAAAGGEEAEAGGAAGGAPGAPAPPYPGHAAAPAHARPQPRGVVPLVHGQEYAADVLAVWSFARSFGPALQLHPFTLEVRLRGRARARVTNPDPNPKPSPNPSPNPKQDLCTALERDAPIRHSTRDAAAGRPLDGTPDPDEPPRIAPLLAEGDVSSGQGCAPLLAELHLRLLRAVGDIGRYGEIWGDMGRHREI